MGKFIDLTGKRYGRLLVRHRNEANDNYNKPLWVCKCDCGVFTTVNGSSLRYGKTRSCGCYSKEVATKVGKERFTKHGKTYTHEHKVWLSMKNRVKRPNKDTYRGLVICETWSNSFEAFLKDMGESPSSEHQLDRIDNAKGYFPENCRWVTRSENCRNRTNNVRIKWKGQTKCLYEWAETICPLLGIKPDSLQNRIKKGWDVEKAFTTPKLKNQFSSST
jgi:hypothetical protein